ncbi:MAG: type ISP restriction/modification enzyme, partial [Candidatus Saccharimonadaceae bacterium]
TIFAGWLSAEANEANHIKRDTPVMCIIGNPPYSGESANKGDWIMNLMEDYKKEPGGKEKLKERNPKWINDDYVKFLRYGQHYIEKNGSGVLAFINPHGFLDNPTFRGMRWNLLKTYDKIYTIDLHGNSKKKEVSPDGSADVNVFDIQQGVSINIFVKTGKKEPNELGKVFHYDLYGSRQSKYDFLKENSLRTINYVELPNVAPDYFMVQKDFKAQDRYMNGFSLSELFPVNSVGIVTSRDGFIIDDDKDILENRVKSFFEFDREHLMSIYKLKENKSWKINDVKKSAKQFEQGCIMKVAYRPFDNKQIYYNENFIERSRSVVMQHFLKNKNVGLVFSRQATDENWTSIQISNNMIDNRFHFSYKGIPMQSPLYIYPETTDQPTFDQSTERTPNLNPKIVREIEKGLGLTFVPEKEENNLCFANNNDELRDEYKQTFAPIDLLDYIYAVLHSPSYREKYKEFLKIDFPRVPYPEDADKFWQLVKLGSQIREIHLLESPAVRKFITGYPKEGTNEITTGIARKDWEITDEEKQLGRIWINESQYFDNIPLSAWEFYIGGYQPAQKWLKDRRGRILGVDDIMHYQKIIVALAETERLMGEIDAIELTIDN